jgi:tRNA pseudouridine-54 N-methylase
VRQRASTQRPLLIYGPGFEHAIGEMDKIAICVTDALASGHVMRTQVVVAVAVSYVPVRRITHVYHAAAADGGRSGSTYP